MVLNVLVECNRTNGRYSILGIFDDLNKAKAYQAEFTKNDDNKNIKYRLWTDLPLNDIETMNFMLKNLTEQYSENFNPFL